MYRCYNPAKNWQLEWYGGVGGNGSNPRKMLLEPKGVGWSHQEVNMVGIADYMNSGLPVVLKLETDTTNDYFVGFNRATGVNSQNDEADNEVTVVQTGKNGEGYSQSYLKATLTQGQRYTIPNFGESGKTLTITAAAVDIGTSPGIATVCISFDVDDNGNALCGTRAPTTSPTTSPPTTSSAPSLSPTTPQVSCCSIVFGNVHWGKLFLIHKYWFSFFSFATQPTKSPTPSPTNAPTYPSVAKYICGKFDSDQQICDAGNTAGGNCLTEGVASNNCGSEVNGAKCQWATCSGGPPEPTTTTSKYLLCVFLDGEFSYSLVTI